MSEEVIKVGETRCCRCNALLVSIVESGKEINRITKIENKGSFKTSLSGMETVEYKDLCPRCYSILANLVKKTIRVKRGNFNKKKGA